MDENKEVNSTDPKREKVRVIPYYPDLALPEQTDYPIGKYGQMHLAFIKKHRRGTYTTLLSELRLNAYLYEVDREARSIVENMTYEIAKSRGIDSFNVKCKLK